MKRSSLFQTGRCVNGLLVEERHQLTCDIPVAVKTGKSLAAKSGRSYSHKIDGLSLDSGYKPSGHVSSNTSRLPSGMSLFESER